MAGISLNSITKSYGKTTVVRDISLKIAQEEFLVLVGPSGCGKSTTLRMIAGLEAITRGEIYIGRKLVNNLPPRKRNISMVFQNYALYPHMTARENLGFGLKIARQPDEVVAERVAEAADILGLTDLLDRTPAELSGGQRQRVAMGRAIVRHPEAFLFDEPLSNLDAKLRVQMRAEIKKLHQKVKTTVVYVTHDQVEAMTLADRIVVMRDGNIEQVGSPMQVFSHPVNAFVAGFIGSPPMNLLPSRVEKNRLRFKDGTLLPIPSHLTKFVHLGQELLFGIRADDISPIGHGIHDGKQSAELELPVIIAELLGTETLIYSRMAEQEIQCKMFNPKEVTAGKTLRFRLALDKAHLFHADNGNSVRSG